MPSAKPLRRRQRQRQRGARRIPQGHGRMAGRPRRRHPRHAGGARLDRRPAGAARRRVGHPARPRHGQGSRRASRSRAATAPTSTASSSARPTSTAPGDGSRPTTRSAAACSPSSAPTCTRARPTRPKQVEKYRFLDAMEARLPELAAHSELALVVGDLNVGHRTLDIRNWKGNVKRAGLPARRARVLRPLRRSRGRRRLQPRAPASAGSTSAAASPARSTARTRGGRGAARRSTTTPDGASTTSSPRPRWPTTAVAYAVDRAATYDERWSDHAPVVVDYAI